MALGNVSTYTSVSTGGMGDVAYGFSSLFF